MRSIVNFVLVCSASGQKRKSPHGHGMSVLPSRTDIVRPPRHVRLVPTADSFMATAEHREPCDSRGSCTVLGAPGGEIPPGDSTIATGPLPLIGTRGPIWSENRPDSDGKARGTCCSSSVTEPRSMAMQDQMECEPSTPNAGAAE